MREAKAKGNRSVLKGSREIAISGKHKGKCMKRDACSFRHHDSKHRESTRSSSPTPKSQTNNEGEILRKGRPPRGSSPSGKTALEVCARITSEETYTNPHRVILGILPCARITRARVQVRRKVSLFCTHREADRQPNERTIRRVEEKAQWPW